MHPNRISNPGFAGDLDNWTAAGNARYVADEGNDELGAASLPDAGSSIEQEFTVPVGRRQMIDIYAKAASAGTVAVTITDQDGNTAYSNSPAVTTSWSNVLGERVGLSQGTYTLNIAWADQALHVDDVSVAWVIKTRDELAADVAELLGDLATQDAGYATDANGDDTEGDYTTAVDVGLRAVGATDRRGEPDVRYLHEQNVDACIDEVQRFMLNKLHRYYTRHATDFTLEGRTEHYHQRVAAIENLLGISVGGRPAGSGRAVQVRRLVHKETL